MYAGFRRKTFDTQEKYKLNFHTTVMDFLNEPELNDNVYFTDETTYSFDTGNVTLDLVIQGGGTENQQYPANDNCTSMQT